jgi:large subunit ribosomal protein L25
MKQITLNIKPREEIGRSANKNLRAGGTIPAVIYGESGNHKLSVDAHEFKMAYRNVVGSAVLIELNRGGDDESQFAIIQELQRNTRTDEFLHIDFKEIVRGQEMEADIPVHPVGTADGVKNYGGVLEVSAHTLRVRCRPRHLPESIEIDVRELAIGKVILLSEVTAPEGVTFLDDPETVVVGCVGSSGGASEAAHEAEEEAEEAAADEEAAAEPAAATEE